MVKGGAVQSVGYNKLYTAPHLVSDESERLLRRISIHAEMDAVRQCGDPHGTTLYVARLGRNGKVSLSKPCKNCEKELAALGVRRVIYTISEHEYGVLNLRGNYK